MLTGHQVAHYLETLPTCPNGSFNDGLAFQHGAYITYRQVLTRQNLNRGPRYNFNAVYA